MDDLLKELLLYTRVEKRKYKDYPHLTPKEQHHLGMEAAITVRLLKRKITVYAIKKCIKIPILFSTLGYKITENTPIRIKNYLFKRTDRSKWASEINKALEMDYTYPNKY